jgi:hypothetical protein
MSTGDDQPTVDPPPQPVLAPTARSRRLPLVLGLAAAAAVLVAAVVVVVALTVNGSDPRAEFDAAAEDFHTELADLRERIDANLGADAIPGLGISEAGQDLDEVATLCRAYQDTLREIDFPEQALAERDRLIDVVEAYHIVAVNAAASLTPGAAQAIVALWDEADPELRSAEDALRAALD